VPLAATISGANVHDKHRLAPTLDAIVVKAPRGPRRPKNLCLDKGYDDSDCDAAVRGRGIEPYVRRREENKLLGRFRGDGSLSAQTAGTTASGCSFARRRTAPTISRSRGRHER
jgi:hypothetical protein